MRTKIVLATLVAGFAASFAPAANAGPVVCEPYFEKVCVPSACFTAANVISTVNEAAGKPLGPGTFPHCID